MRKERFLMTAVTAITVLFVCAGRAHSERGSIPILVQVTRNTLGDVEGPKVSLALADYVTFVSDGDVMGPGSSPGHREVYLYRVADGTIVRVTDSASGESYEATKASDDAVTGRYLALVSTADLDPLRGNADGNPEVFLWDLATGEFIQITDTPPGVENRRPWVSDQAKCLTFDSNGDLDDNPLSPNDNPDGSREAFLFEVVGATPREGMTTQASDGPAGTTSSNVIVGGYVFTFQCRSTAFQSDHDQIGLGTSGTQLYVYTKASGGLELISVPGTGGDNINPSISAASRFARGPFVVFQSEADLKGNGSSGFEIFRARVFHTQLRQVTYLETGVAEKPVVSDGGGWIAFESDTRSIFTKGGQQLNADGNREIFRLKGRRLVQQITDTAGCTNGEVSLSGDARALAFRSTCDLVPGSNPSGVPQVFLYREVKPGDPALSDCRIEDGCCSEENGCFTRIMGKMPKIPRRPG